MFVLVLTILTLSLTLDVEGQIRTTRSIISDTAQIRNLDVTNEFVTKGLDLRGH